jgi:NAD(P)-dependent dehydrogenase (short-subunit alcohol dehydrogenase family)
MNDDLFLRNRPTIAVVTGGTQGLGLAIAKRLAFEGAQGIVISGRNAEKGEDAAAGVRVLGTDCIFADVSNADDCYKLIDAAIAHFGTVNGLVNSAELPTAGLSWIPRSSFGSGISIPTPAVLS